MRKKQGGKKMGKLSGNKKVDTTQREELLHRIERITELPLLVLAFVMIPLLITRRAEFHGLARG
jgi:hypothetical protein